MCGEQGFKAVHETVRKVKFIGKGFSIVFSRVLMLRYFIVLLHIKYCIRPGFVWYLPAAQQLNKVINFRFVLMLVCVKA